MEHLPVMPAEVIEGLALEQGGIYLDCTFGRGGHSRLILERLGPGGRLVALDRDQDAIDSTAARALQADPRFELVYASFADLQSVVRQRDWVGRVSGILMDLGVSSPQLDKAERGFSFLKEGPLDMRMDTGRGISAAQWLAQVEEADLVRVLKEYGEERFARRIARAVVQKRAQTPIATTRQLAALVEQAVPLREKHKHPATRTFQAIRIEINGELEALQAGLRQTVDVLRPSGRLVLISFHSLEDRIVKRFIRSESKGGDFPAGLPVTVSAFRPRLRKVGKAQRPGEQELLRNPRARSAVLRVAERLP